MVNKAFIKYVNRLRSMEVKPVSESKAEIIRKLKDFERMHPVDKFLGYLLGNKVEVEAWFDLKY